MARLRGAPAAEVTPESACPGRTGRLGVGLGVGRALAGAAWLAAPVSSVRLLGLDTATATRVSWLVRMAAARDLVLGAGTVRAIARGRGAAGWLLAGALTDLADAALVEQALRQGRAKGAPANGVVLVAAASAVAGAWAAIGSARRAD